MENRLYYVYTHSGIMCAAYSIYVLVQYTHFTHIHIGKTDANFYPDNKRVPPFPGFSRVVALSLIPFK